MMSTMLVVCGVITVASMVGASVILTDPQSIGGGGFISITQSDDHDGDTADAGILTNPQLITAGTSWFFLLSLTAKISMQISFFLVMI